MKNIPLFTVLLVPIFLICSFSSTELSEDFKKCKVLKESINKEYEGDCKKGLAHGQGTAKGDEDYYQGSFKKGQPYGKGKYVWGNGEFYQGEFKNGMRHGEGIMYAVNKETGVIEKGKLSRWKDDKFLMEIMEENYKIVQKRNLVGVGVKKMDEERERVELNIKNSVELRDVVINHNVGSMNKLRDDRIVIDFIEFPINLMINYTTANKFNGNRVKVVVEMIIESPGNWKVDLNN